MTTYDHQRTPAERGDYWVAVHTWVFQADLSHVALCTYIGLMSFADRSGRCWPERIAVADRMHLSKRSIANGIKELEEKGILTHERQTSGGRTIASVYQLKVIADPEEGLEPDIPVDGPHGEVYEPAPPSARPAPPGAPGASPGAPGAHKGVHQVHCIRNTSKEHLQGTPPKNTMRARDADAPVAAPADAVADEILDAEILDDDCADVGTLDVGPVTVGRPRPIAASSTSTEQVFEEFWQAFPRERRTAKRQCRQKFTKAVKDGTPPSEIIAAARRYAADPNRAPAYTASPLTWLNQGRWEDGPLPPRGGAQPSPLGNTDHLTDEDWQAIGDDLWTPTDPCDPAGLARRPR